MPQTKSERCGFTPTSGPMKGEPCVLRKGHKRHHQCSAPKPDPVEEAFSTFRRMLLTDKYGCEDYGDDPGFYGYSQDDMLAAYRAGVEAGEKRERERAAEVAKAELWDSYGTSLAMSVAAAIRGE